MGRPKTSAQKQSSHRAIAPLREPNPTAGASPKHVKPAEPLTTRAPGRCAYALKQYTCERRAEGWFVGRTPATGEKTEWSVGFDSIETACLAIARRLAVEIADRHSRTIEIHSIAVSDPMHGLKATTRLDLDDGSAP
jgi:hypothetical protein